MFKYSFDFKFKAVKYVVYGKHFIEKLQENLMFTKNR